MCPFGVLYLCNRMAANQVDFKILPSDQFSVYSPQTRSDKVITYFTLLSKLRGDILSVGQEDDPNNIVSAFYSSVGGTQTLHLVKADGSEVTASVPEPTVGTVTSVDLTASTGISVSGGPITTSGSITVTNTAPDQVVVLTGAGTTSISGTYPSFTITSNDQFVGTVTSVGLTMPAAFSVANSPVTASGTLAVTAAGLSSQYIRGDGQLANFPTPGGGGSSVNYYLNGSVSQGTFGGDTYYELSKTPIAGAGTNFTRTSASGDGYVASFITDANDPDQINIPGGNWNLEFYFNSSSSGGSPAFYGELYKVSISNVFTLIASGSVNPESITGGTSVDQYYTSIAVPQTALLATDRLAIRVYVIVSGKDITLHTENSNFSEVITTFSTGLNSLNGLSDQVQYFAVGTSGTDFAISSSLDTHTFNLPTASATNRGALSSADWTTFNSKEPALTKGNLTEATSSVLTITGGTGAVIGSGTTIQVSQAGASASGFLSSTDWNTFNNKQGTITLTTTGSTGAATFISNTLNIPNYADQFVGTVTSVAALTLGTTGTDLSSSVVDSTTTPVITLNVPTASATNRGALSSADWTTFNSKEPALTKGNLTEATSAVLTITGGTGAVIGTGTTIQVAQSGVSTSGFLSSTDWNTFNGKQGALTFTAPLVNTSGTVSIPTATSLVDGYLSAANFVTFNGKQDALTLTTTGTTGAATLIGATLNIPNYADQYVGTVTSVNMSVPTGFAISGNPITTSGTLAVAFASGYSLPTDASQATWNTAYNDSITAFAYNTSTGVLTLTQQDAGTLTATVTLQPFSTTNLAEGTNLYYTDVRARLALSAGTGISYNTTTGVITNSAPDLTVVLTASTGISVTGTYPSFTIANTAPDQTVALTGAGTTTISGAYPSFTITSNDQFVGTVTSVGLTASTGISVSGSPITTSGSITVTNTAPDQVVVLTASTGISTSGTYPNFTVTNTAPDQVVSLTGAGTTTITGTYPNFTISSDDQYDGTVTSVNLTAGARIEVSGGPITTSGSITVTHGTSGGADVATAQSFRLRVIADGGTFEAFNDVAIAIGSLEDIATPQDTDNSGGTVLQNVVLDEFGHLLGVGSITLDTDDIIEGSTNLYFTNTRARSALSAGTGITYNTSTGIITNSAPDQVVVLTAGTGITTSGTYPSFTVTNSAPDQVVSLTGAGTTTISGTYPSFTITSSDQFVGTVTSVNLTASTGISVSGGPITTSGSITVTNTAPDQTVVLTAGTGISTSGTYPSFTVTNSAPDQTVVLTASTGITTSGTYPNFTIANSAPDQTVVLTGGTGITTSGTYPSFTITNSAPDQTVVLTAGTGITTSGTYPNFTVTNSAPDQTVAITAGTGISVSGTYPNFTVTNSSPSSGGTVTSVAALTIGTTGTDLSSTVANGTTTPVITLQVPTASATNRGALSSTDWTTFNSKQGAITLTTTGSTGAATFISNTLNIPNYTDQFVGTVTSVNLTAGTRIEVAGGPITTSGSITVTHGVAAGADFTTAQTFEARVLADGGIFEALGEVAIAIGSLADAASPSSTDFNDGVVIQNVAIDEFGHLLGVGATDLDERYVQNLTAGTGITVSGSPSSTAGLITVTNNDRGSSQNIFKNIAVTGQTTIVADTNDDTLTIVAGTGISVTTNNTTDTLTITNTTASFIPVFAGYSSGGVTLATDATVYDFKIDTETIIDSSIYSHSTSVDSEEITVLSDGTYEITYSGVLFNANANASAAAVVDFKIFKNGVVLDDPLNTAQNVAHLNTSSYNYINQISNSYIVELLNNDIIKLTISAAYQGGGSPSPAVKFGFQGSAKNNLTIKKLY